MQFSKAGPVTREQNSDDVRQSRSQCRWCLLLLYITHGYKRGTGLCVAKKLWQKSVIPATVTNVEMANALVLLQNDSQDHGTTDYALCPHYMLWHIATFNSSANWKIKGQELIHKKVKSPKGLRLAEGEILFPCYSLCGKNALRHYVLSDLGEGDTLACKGCDWKEWFSSATVWIHSLTRLSEKANSCRDRCCD